MPEDVRWAFIDDYLALPDVNIFEVEQRDYLPTYIRLETLLPDDIEPLTDVVFRISPGKDLSVGRILGITHYRGSPYSEVEVELL